MNTQKQRERREEKYTKGLLQGPHPTIRHFILWALDLGKLLWKSERSKVTPLGETFRHCGNTLTIVVWLGKTCTT
jgi:hypothetical protein